MKQFLEFLPIVLFFVAYQMSGDTMSVGSWSHTFNGIFSATAVLLIATVVQAVILLAVYKKLERREIGMILAVIGFGSLTLLFRNELFIQWKPTIFNWVLAIVFLLAPIVSKKTLVERALGGHLQVPHNIFMRLNYFWVVYFAVVGTANLYVAYSFEESFWVSYKLYSAIGFTIFLSVATVLILAPHMKELEQKEEN